MDRAGAPALPLWKRGSWRGILWGGWGLWAVSLALLLYLGGPVGAEEIELGFLNGTYTGLDAGLAPIEEGLLTIRLSSPEHRLVVHRARLSLERDYRGRIDAAVEVELEGEGRLIADVAGVGNGSRFTDDVSAPRQTVKARGEVRLKAAEGGYLFTIVRPGPAVAFEIQSGVAAQIVDVCRVLALLPLIDLGCDRVEAALSVVRVPLPERGTELLLPAEGLSAEERAFFDRLAARPPGS